MDKLLNVDELPVSCVTPVLGTYMDADKETFKSLLNVIPCCKWPVLHDWCSKGRGMCNPVCGMVNIKEPLLLIGKSSLCGGSGCPLSR